MEIGDLCVSLLNILWAAHKSTDTEYSLWFYNYSVPCTSSKGVLFIMQCKILNFFFIPEIVN